MHFSPKSYNLVLLRAGNPPRACHSDYWPLIKSFSCSKCFNILTYKTYWVGQIRLKWGKRIQLMETYAGYGMSSRHVVQHFSEASTGQSWRQFQQLLRGEAGCRRAHSSQPYGGSTYIPETSKRCVYTNKTHPANTHAKQKHTLQCGRKTRVRYNNKGTYSPLYSQERGPGRTNEDNMPKTKTHD